MATLDELYTNVLADEAEKAAFAEAAKTPEGLAAFLEAHGCDATPEQVAEFLKARRSEEGEISDAELDSVAGGCNAGEAAHSIISFGISCAAAAIMSAVDGSMRGEDGQILCDIDYS